MSDAMLVPPHTVLVVDDQPIVRRLAHRILSEMGYRVFEAEDGEEAFDVLALTGPVDVLAVDIVMPKLDGAAFIRRVLERWPEQQFLYMSAYSAEILASYDAPLTAPFLAKPFTRDELLAKVAQALRLGAGERPPEPLPSEDDRSGEAGA